LFVSLSEVSGHSRLLCNVKMIAHVQRTLLHFILILNFTPGFNFIRHGGKCADEKAHEWSLFKRAKESTKSFTIIRSVRAAIAQARRRLLRTLRVTAAAANRAHAVSAFVAGPLFKEFATAIVAAAATIWYQVRA
jgi:hypothetical protein